jgi:hypothetical protein
MFSSRVVGMLAAGSIAASASVGPRQHLAPAWGMLASTCKTHLAGGPSGAPGKPPTHVFAHARSTCDYVYGVKLQMTFYKNGVKVGEKKICQDGPVSRGPRNMTCEVHVRVKDKVGTVNWKMKVTAQWITNSGKKVTKFHTKKFRA